MMYCVRCCAPFEGLRCDYCGTRYVEIHIGGFSATVAADGVRVDQELTPIVADGDVAFASLSADTAIRARNVLFYATADVYPWHERIPE